MKRLHIHVSVDDLAAAIGFYSGLFASAPTVHKDDYAKWMLDDPRVNFAISQRGLAAGVNHLGIQVESAAELAQMHERLAGLQGPLLAEEDAACCYARSNKYWVDDPAGVAWETFHTLDAIPVYGADAGGPGAQPAACCVPLAHPAPAAACCVPAADAARAGGACC